MVWQGRSGQKQSLFSLAHRTGDKVYQWQIIHRQTLLLSAFLVDGHGLAGPDNYTTQRWQGLSLVDFAATLSRPRTATEEKAQFFRSQQIVKNEDLRKLGWITGT